MAVIVRRRVHLGGVPVLDDRAVAEVAAHRVRALDVVHHARKDDCRGAWARVTIDQFRHWAFQTG